MNDVSRDRPVATAALRIERQLKRVVHVSQPVEAGVAKVVAQVAKLQMAQGLDVTIVSPPGWLEDVAVEAGVSHARWEATRHPGRSVPREAAQLEGILRALHPDLVHLHSSKAGLAGRLSLRARVPTVFQPHAWSFHASQGGTRSAAIGWERWAARWTDLTICCSDDERLAGVRAGIQGMSLSVGNGIDLERFPVPSPEDRLAARARLGIAGTVPLAVCVGRLQPQKGQDTAIGAWNLVRAQVEDAQLLLVGAGPDELSLRSAAGEGVVFAGPTSEVRDYFLAADVCLVPSRWEGLSLALLEGMACARTTVATDVSGSRELLLGGAPAGDVVGVGDTAGLVAAVIRRLTNTALARREGVVARARIERSYTILDVAKRLSVGYGLVWRLRYGASLRRSRPGEARASLVRQPQ